MDKYTVYTTAEECSEVSQALMKVLRFGFTRINPSTGIANYEQLETEIGQLKYCLDRIENELDLDTKIIDKAYTNKHETWETWKEFYVS